jgi:hypothetical protein
MTIVRLNSSLAAELLIAHLRESSDVSVEALGPEVLRVSLLGSYRADAMSLELVLRLRAWEAAARARGLEVTVVVEDEPS